ncbi:MAG: nitroreductase family protein [Bacteroidales bacterium]|jgi:nitroreductase|nr:nitroreductase family protein [Bacteroidales bacterium]
METLKAILTRRSIRKYSEKNIPEEYYEVLLKAAMHAPSARNRQPWHFIIISDRQVLDQLSEVSPSWKMLADAASAIVICGDLNLEDSESFIIQDCSAATQNILLAAHELGLGSVWLGVHPREDRLKPLIDILQIPRHILPVSMVSVGKPDEDREQPDRYNIDRIHQDKW